MDNVKKVIPKSGLNRGLACKNLVNANQTPARPGARYPVAVFQACLYP
jgi:hypothetical protein